MSDLVPVRTRMTAIESAVEDIAHVVRRASEGPGVGDLEVMIVRVLRAELPALLEKHLATTAPATHVELGAETLERWAEQADDGRGAPEDVVVLAAELRARVAQLEELQRSRRLPRGDRQHGAHRHRCASAGVGPARRPVRRASLNAQRPLKDARLRRRRRSQPVRRAPPDSGCGVALAQRGAPRAGTAGRRPIGGDEDQLDVAAVLDSLTSQMESLYRAADHDDPVLTGVDNIVFNSAGELFVARDVNPSGRMMPFASGAHPSMEPYGLSPGVTASA